MVSSIPIRGTRESYFSVGDVVDVFSSPPTLLFRLCTLIALNFLMDSFKQFYFSHYLNYFDTSKK